MSATSPQVLLIDGRTELPPSAGGKALGLQRIVRSGLSVPPAWVVLPRADGVVATALAAAIVARGISRVAVRSSAADEDGGGYSFAGIHETRLCVPLDALPEAVATVAASPGSARAVAYRSQHGLPPPSGPCAVVVQAMLDPEWAGVAFGCGDGVLVEAVEGLGETAVNGDATPETIELVRAGDGWKVARRWPRRQYRALRARCGRLAPVETSGTELPEAIALEVARGVIALERAQRTPLDVEWAARGEEVAFLQARPQTRSLHAGLPPYQTWTRTNVADTFPEIASAMVRSVAVDMLEHGFRAAYDRIGLDLPKEIPSAATVAGRLVFNEAALHRVADTIGVPRSWAQVLVGGTGEPTNAFLAPDPRKVLRRLDVIVRIKWFARRAEPKARAHIDHLRSWYAERAAVAPSEKSDEQLMASGQAWVKKADDAVLHVFRVVHAFQGAFSAGAMALRAHPAPAAFLARLLDPEPVSVSTQQLEELVEIARAMRRWSGASRFLGSILPEHAERRPWRDALPGELWGEIERWLERYGHRGPYESDSGQPRFAEDLRLVAAALRPFLAATEEPESLEARRARRRADFESAWHEVPARLGPLACWRLRRLTRKLSRFMLLREELRSDTARHTSLSRSESLEMGRRLVARGRLDAAEEVFHLTLDALARALRDPEFDARTAVACERARIAAWRRIEVPHRFTSEQVASFARRGVTVTGAEGTLRGTAVSPGEVEGRACVLRSAYDGAKMERGGILVAPTTDPGWTPLFARAAGVVVELGGVLSHAATVAREYGLPCVSNVQDATQRLRDGDLLRVNGTNGSVEVLERAKGVVAL